MPNTPATALPHAATSITAPPTTSADPAHTAPPKPNPSMAAPAAAPPRLADQKTDFTAEGSPPPGNVALVPPLSAVDVVAPRLDSPPSEHHPAIKRRRRRLAHR